MKTLFQSNKAGLGANPLAPCKVLLGHLAARGDCLYATTVAKQIKKDFPNCHLTWAIGSMAKSIIEHNPYVDEVWEIPLDNHTQVKQAWEEFEKLAYQKKEEGLFDSVFFTQISPANFKFFDGTVRASIFRGYPYPITVSLSPVLRLSPQEIERVKDFITAHEIQRYKYVILFEYSSFSGQSFVTLDFALEVGTSLIANNNDDICIILTSGTSFISPSKEIIDGSCLSFRENAELTKYCTLFIGSSSGISWLTTSDWAKTLPTIQLLKKKTSVFASMEHDFQYFGISSASVLEMTECTPVILCKCVKTIFEEGFDIAKRLFHEKMVPDFDLYFEIISQASYKDRILSGCITLKRYGITWAFFKAFLQRELQNTFKKVLLKMYIQACTALKKCLNR